MITLRFCVPNCSGADCLLERLHIKNFAVIDDIEITFSDGMTVFTGETGAGKSIMVEAFGLVLGDRSDSTMIRSGADRTEITATFAIDPTSGIGALLDEQAIDYDDELILRRVVNRDGRPRAFANGSVVPVKLLRSFGAYLVDIHGQHEHQSLVKKDAQVALLDDYGNYPAALSAVNTAWRAWRAHTRELHSLSGHTGDRDAQLALLRHQVSELHALNPSATQLAELEAEHSRLAHAKDLIESGQQALDQLTENDQSVHRTLAQTIAALHAVREFDTSLDATVALLESAAIQINEAGNELRHYVDRLDCDPDKLQALEDKLDSLQSIARKHNVRPDALAELLEQLSDALQTLEDSELRCAELAVCQQQARAEFRAAAARLSACRIDAATRLNQAVSAQLKALGMPQGELSITVHQTEHDAPRKNGVDTISYLVKLNPGQVPKPLAKIASGGELSRISLALQVIGGSDKGTPTMIFDEVDSGIGGGVAEIVGRLLHSLAAKRQVFCVTHLPQVAAQGDHHIRVTKSSTAVTTSTRVTTLTATERIEEIARMLGGVTITDQTRAHAEEMLNCP